MTTKKTARQLSRIHASRVSKAARSFGRRMLREFRDLADDTEYERRANRDMQRMIRADVRDLQRVAALLREDKILKALDLAESIDSIVCEQIPRSTQSFMVRYERSVKGL